MKLNLLPQTVSKGRALKSAWILGAIMMIVSLGLAIMLSRSAHQSLTDAEAQVDAQKQGAADAVTTAAAADTVVSTAADVIRNASLAKAMIDHNDVYPQLYTEILPYIPSFFRINAISATPVSATSCQVTMVGVIKDYQEYSDVMLALMRYKNATSISRSGYTYDPAIVPPVSAEDPIGKPRKPGAAPEPQNQIEEIQYLQSQPRETGYLNVGNYGTTGISTKGAMPGETLITIEMTVNKNLQSPDPEATLAASGSASAGAAATAASLGGPGGLSGPPSGAPGGPGGGARGGRGGASEGGD